MSDLIDSLMPPAEGLLTDAALALVRHVADINSGLELQHGAVIGGRGQIAEGTELVFVGDLHSRYDNLKKILAHNDLIGKIAAGSVILVMLGDAVHGELRRSLSDAGEPGRLQAMDDSILTMQFIMRLKERFPNNVFYCLGNHDYLTKKYRKGGVLQGWEYRKALKNKYGMPLVKAYEAFLASSPLLFIADGIVANHAGPLRDNCSLDDLIKTGIAGDENRGCVEQGLWRRWKHHNDFLRYEEEDVEKFLASVVKQPNAVYLVGHSPNMLYYDEYRVARFAARLMQSHYMIFAAYDEFGYARFMNGAAPDSIEFVEV